MASGFYGFCVRFGDLEHPIRRNTQVNPNNDDEGECCRIGDVGALRGGGDLAHPTAATAQPQQQVPHRTCLEDLALRRFLTQTACLAAALVARQPGHRRLDLPTPSEQRFPFWGAIEGLRLP